MITVALDAMGGDLGVRATIPGAAKLSLESSDIQILLVGDVPTITAALHHERYDPQKIIVVHSEGVVQMQDKPRAALDAMPNCSVLTAARLVQQGEADALVSAGNTGATILGASQTFQRIPGIRRTALASVYPTQKRHGPYRDPFALMLDVGATLNATPQDLATFAVMGSAYSSIISRIEKPKIGLLSNGTEANKGTAAIIEAHQLLLRSKLNFHGNVEGLDIPKGGVDLIVCDGFLGNVVLKMLEGVSDVVTNLAKQASGRSLQWKIGLSMLGGGIRKLRRMTDWKAYGGAPVLGFDQVVIKAHGRSEQRAIRNALKVAAKSVRGDLTGKIIQGVSSLEP